MVSRPAAGALVLEAALRGRLVATTTAIEPVAQADGFALALALPFPASRFQVRLSQMGREQTSPAATALTAAARRWRRCRVAHRLQARLEKVSPSIPGHRDFTQRIVKGPTVPDQTEHLREDDSLSLLNFASIAAAKVGGIRHSLGEVVHETLASQLPRGVVSCFRHGVCNAPCLHSSIQEARIAVVIV